jgi:zinc transporter
MNEHARLHDAISLPSEPGPHGLFFHYHFDANGLKCEAAEAIWSWRSYMISDIRARHSIAEEPGLPIEVRDAFLSSGAACNIDFEDGWLFGDLPDLHHDYSAEAKGLGHFRFAFNDTMLIGARKQPLDSVELVRRQIEKRAKPFRSPAALIEAVMMHSFAGLTSDLMKLADELDGIEDRIVADSWDQERESLTDVRRRLVVIHRQMATLTNLFRHLDQSHRHDDIPEIIEDMAARLSQRSLVLHHDGEQLQARARLLQDELMAKLTAQSNKLLYVLSIMTAVLLPMTIITGLFGMNVGGIPFTSGPEGFWVVTVISLVIAAGTLWFMRKISERM